MLKLEEPYKLLVHVTCSCFPGKHGSLCGTRSVPLPAYWFRSARRQKAEFWNEVINPTPLLLHPPTFYFARHTYVRSLQGRQTSEGKHHTPRRPLSLNSPGLETAVTTYIYMFSGNRAALGESFIHSFLIIPVLYACTLRVVELAATTLASSPSSHNRNEIKAGQRRCTAEMFSSSCTPPQLVNLRLVGGAAIRRPALCPTFTWSL